MKESETLTNLIHKILEKHGIFCPSNVVQEIAFAACDFLGIVIMAGNDTSDGETK